MAAFCSTFVTRAIALWLVYFGVWPTFAKTYCNGNYSTANSLVFVFEFILYNIIPIGYLTLIHHFNFRQMEIGSTPSSPIDAPANKVAHARPVSGDYSSSRSSSVRLVGSNSILDYSLHS